MKKSRFVIIVATLLVVGILSGCAGQPAASSVPASSASEVSSQPVSSSQPEETGDAEAIKVAGLKGPTTMGMVKLMDDARNGATKHAYEVEMYGTADEIVPKLVSGEVPIAAVPANLASVLYNNTQGGVKVAAINTLGVLYVVETGEAVQSIEDLRGKTVYSTGKGTTPEFALNYILSQNGLDPTSDLTIEYKSEATEIAALLGTEQDAIAVLPQPYVTAVQMQNEAVRVALSLTEEWDKVSPDSGMVTGVLVVSAAWLAENADSFNDFLADYEASISWVNGNTADAAALVAEFGIVEKAPVAEKALPACNIVYIAGEEMQAKLAGYLQVLFDQKPESVGGTLPDDAFYYLG